MNPFNQPLPPVAPSELLHTAIMNAASDGILILDETGRIQACNTSATQIMGYSQTELTEKTLVQLLPEPFQAQFEQWKHDAATTRSPGQRHHLQATRCNGQEFPVALTFTAVSSEDPFSIIVALQDMTEYQEMAKAKEHAENRLQRESLVRRLVAMVNDSLDMGVILETTAREIGMFLKADRAIVTRYNYDSEAKRLEMVMTSQYCSNEQIAPYSDEDWEVIFKAFQHLTMDQVKAYQPATIMQHEPEQMTKFYEHLFDTLDVTDVTIEHMMAFQKKYGAKATMRTRIKYNDMLLGFMMLQQCSYQRNWEPDEIDLMEFVADQIGIALAQADLYKAEQQARQSEAKANARKSEFLAMMSHELRTPLNAIIGYSQMLKLGLGGPMSEKQIQYLLNVEKSGTHLLDIVNSLLDVSQIEAGHLAVVPKTFELQPILEEVRSLVQALANQKEISLSFEVQPKLQTVEADPARFKQILINLLSNAIKFNHPHGQVILRLRQSGDRNWLIGEVEDNGIGIPADKQADLFSKFYQVDSRLARQHEGTGLGLALTKDLVELHGGRISVESREGEGAKFTFTLPAHPHPGKPTA